MLSWASYLFGSSATPEEQKIEQTVAMETETPSNDKDWVVVDHADCCFGHLPTAQRSNVTCYPGNQYHGYPGNQYHGDAFDMCSTLSDLSACSKSDSSSPSKLSTPGSLSPVCNSRHLFVRTNHGHSMEAWILTPPSCFTAGHDEMPKVGITDLENLLIEHPSMSVYKRSGSAGEESNCSDESSSEIVVVKSKRSHGVSRQDPKHARAISARAELMSQVSKVKHAQKLQQQRTTKRNNKKGLEKLNKVSVCDKHISRKNRVRNPSGRMNGRTPQRKQ